jgi:hypothetical protein
VGGDKAPSPLRFAGGVQDALFVANLSYNEVAVFSFVTKQKGPVFKPARLRKI